MRATTQQLDTLSCQMQCRVRSCDSNPNAGRHNHCSRGSGPGACHSTQRCVELRRRHLWCAKKAMPGVLCLISKQRIHCRHCCVDLNIDGGHCTRGGHLVHLTKSTVAVRRWSIQTQSAVEGLVQRQLRRGETEDALDILCRSTLSCEVAALARAPVQNEFWSSKNRCTALPNLLGGVSLPEQRLAFDNQGVVFA